MTRALSPRSIDEAAAFLAAEPDLVPIAGCTDLMVAGAGDGQEPAGVLDLSGVAEIQGIRTVAGEVEIGAGTTFSRIRRDESVARLFPALARAAAVVGGWQIQNRATLGGNIANASPAGDSLPVLLVLDARLILVGPEGRREIPYQEFHTGYRETALAPDELIGWIRLPLPAPGTRQAFRKVGTRQAQAISKVVAALAARIDDGRIATLRLAAGSVASTPVRLTGVEAELAGRPLDRETGDLAERLAAAAVEPIDDVRSTADYRRWALGRIVRRMLFDLATQPG